MNRLLPADVRIHRPLALARKLRHGSTGLAQAYVDGDWDADDLVGALRRLARTLAPLQRVLDAVVPKITLGRPSAAPRSDRARDRRQIRAHYDLSDEFFSLLLDPTMAYSCAVFDHPLQPLEEAQVNKFDRLLDLLEVGPDDHLLEIGTGWGGLALRAAAARGCRVTTTTISANQHHRALERVTAAGLGHRITVLDRDWRDLTGSYTKVVSVEMIEAVHWTELDAFVAACHRLVVPGGRAAIQAIVIDDDAYERYKHTEDEFIRTMVFPGGCLPSTRALQRAAARTGLAVAGLDDLTQHYPSTLARWQQNLDAKASVVRDLGFDDRLLRLWRFYLAYSSAGFLERRVRLVQMTLVAPEVAAAPAAGSMVGMDHHVRDDADRAARSA